MRLDENFCLCKTPIHLGSLLVGCLFLFWNIIEMVYGLSNLTKSDEFYQTVTTNLLLSVPEILLLFGQNKNAFYCIPFLFSHAINFIGGVVETLVTIFVSLGSMIHQKVSQAPEPHTLHQFLTDYNLWDTCHDLEFGFFLMLVVFAIVIAILAVYAYLWTVVYRSYRLLKNSNKVEPYVRFVNPNHDSFAANENQNDIKIEIV